MTAGPRLRIAPSPTGSIHIGTARTALYNWLWARQKGGVFVLRVEDTARDRFRPEWEQAIYDGLRWLGLDWDEGPDGSGDFGPYRQSERAEAHREKLDLLIAGGHCYRCFCTPQQLAEERTAAQKRREPPRYSGRCRDLSDDEVERRLAGGEKASWRFRCPDHVITFDDWVMGNLREDASLWGDFIVARSDGSPVYNFAVVADDSDMAVTDVLRGADHISNTFKQIALYEALSLTPPRFGHVPLTLNSRRQKLSKRDGSVSIQEYRDLGYLPEAVNNFIALLGWNPGDEREFFTLAELTAEFDINRVNRSNGIFDMDRLDWFNGSYLRRMAPAELAKRAWAYLDEYGYFAGDGAPARTLGDTTVEIQPIDRPPFEYFKAALELEQERVKRLSDLPAAMDFFFRDQVDPKPKDLIARRESPAATAAALTRVADWASAGQPLTEEAAEEFLRGLAETLGWKAGTLFMPIRMALTGSRAAPPLFVTMAVLGAERVAKRMRAAVARLDGEDVQ